MVSPVQVRVPAVCVPESEIVTPAPDTVWVLPTLLSVIARGKIKDISG